MSYDSTTDVTTIGNLKNAFIVQIDRTVEAHASVLKEMDMLRKRNEELLQMRG